MSRVGAWNWHRKLAAALGGLRGAVVSIPCLMRVSCDPSRFGGPQNFIFRGIEPVLIGA